MLTARVHRISSWGASKVHGREGPSRCLGAASSGGRSESKGETTVRGNFLPQEASSLLGLTETLMTSEQRPETLSLTICPCHSPLLCHPPHLHLLGALPLLTVLFIMSCSSCQLMQNKPRHLILTVLWVGWLVGWLVVLLTHPGSRSSHTLLAGGLGQLGCLGCTPLSTWAFLKGSLCHR